MVTIIGSVTSKKPSWMRSMTSMKRFSARMDRKYNPSGSKNKTRGRRLTG